MRRTPWTELEGEDKSGLLRVRWAIYNMRQYNVIVVSNFWTM
jgi:hypothetical protein